MEGMTEGAVTLPAKRHWPVRGGVRLWSRARWAREAVSVAPAEVPDMMKPACGVVKGGSGEEVEGEKEWAARDWRMSQASCFVVSTQDLYRGDQMSDGAETWFQNTSNDDLASSLQVWEKTHVEGGGEGV